jgi:sporulation integral membrane protein YlbJ
MTRLLRKQWIRELLVVTMLCLAAAGILTAPRTTSEAAREGLYMCIDVLIPSLFPFFVLSTLVIEMNMTRPLGRMMEPVMRPLFRVNGSCSAAVILGFLGGYPVGAKCAISLYEKGRCSKVEAERLLAFCNNSGPAFILGAAGVGILGSSRAGWLLYLSHTAASLTVGLLFRFYKTKDQPTVDIKQASVKKEVRSNFTDAFITSVKSSFESVFYISAFVIFFTAVVRLLFTSGAFPAAASALSSILAPLGLTEDMIEDLLTGLVELTSGLFSVRDDTTAGLRGKIAMAAFMLGWAGLSVHCQVLSFAARSGLSSRTYIWGKILHASISALYAYLLTVRIGLDIPVTETIAGQVETISRLRFRDTFGLTVTTITAMVLVLLLIAGVRVLRRKPTPPKPSEVVDWQG